MRNWALIGACGLALAGVAGPALAAGEEIQVYMDEISPKGHFGLDVHVNYVADGDLVADYPGQQQSRHRLRITPEWSYAITPNLELGAYLPLASYEDGHLTVDGEKLRLKFVAPRPEGRNWFWGANFEIGKVVHRTDINPWNAEAKGIIGTRNGPWTLALNTNIGWVVDGPDKGPAALELATKVSYDLAPDFAIGIESFNDVGELRHLGGDLTALEHSTYVTLDKGFGDWELNFGVGRGYGENPDQWIVKAIIGIPIDRRK
jgi:hypothetical protein